MKRWALRVILAIALFFGLLLSSGTSFAAKVSRVSIKRNAAVSKVAAGAPRAMAPAKNYIVVLKDGSSVSRLNKENIFTDFKVQPKNAYKSALRGFSANLTGEDLARLRQDPRVKFISEDREVQITANQFPAINRSPSFSAYPPKQKKPTGISRINAPHITNKGASIGVAVIDTGIDLDHPDLKENIVANTSCILTAPTGDDDHGHGSHVAGTIAAPDNKIGVLGVAPKAKLIAVKVLNSGGSGQWSEVICGVDWVTAHAAEYNIKVANMSLGGWGSSDNNCGNTNNDALHQALCNSAAAGVTYVVAAGNSGSNASGFVPAAYDDTLITVSALADSDGIPGGQGPDTSRGPDDTFATFSNYGQAVDIGAPGVDIFSTFKNGLFHTYSGTSMASPHVAGSAAAYLGIYPGSTWQNVRDGLRAVAEPLGSGHTDPSGNHPEPIVRLNF